MSGGSSLASWTPLWVLLGIFAAGLVAATVAGRGQRRALPAGLARITGAPAWAATTVVISLFGLLLAGQGFYDDVSWHVALGRDDALFTAPHTAIVIGLLLITLGAVAGMVVATFDRIDTALRWGGLRVPRSCALLGLLGVSALAGFPLDDVWHAEYGVDVTMWSPTHMLMILGAALSGAASWLVLGEAGVPARRRRRWRVLHVVAAWFTLQGLLAPLGEFAFGVPQFDQVFHPLLLCLAAGVAVVPMRLVLGPWWAIGITAVSFVLDASNALSRGLPAEPRAVGVVVTSAIAIELAAVVWRSHVRFAVAAGVGIASIGLAGEWWWNGRAYQPWRAALVPEALALGIPVAVAAAVIGTAVAAAVSGGRRPSSRVLAAAVVVVIAALAWPMPRPSAAVAGAIDVEPAAAGSVHVTVALDDPAVADGARWFQAMAWQGGTLVVDDLREVGPGRWTTTEPVPVGGTWKTMLRLHDGHRMSAAPVWLPADPEIDEAEVPAVDRTVVFGRETRYLLREVRDGSAVTAWLVHALLAVVALAWLAGFGRVLRALAVERVLAGVDLDVVAGGLELAPQVEDRLGARRVDVTH